MRDVTILRFLAAAEILKTDLWQQYNELFRSGLAWSIHEVSSQKRKDALKGMMNTVSPSARDLMGLSDTWCEQFIRICGDQARQILLDLDSTDDPTHGRQQFSFFNGAYNQHMYHPMLVFERHTGSLLAQMLCDPRNHSQPHKTDPETENLGPS